MSLSGSSDSRWMSWAMTRLATVSSIGVPRNTIRPASRREYRSKDRSPRLVCSTTTGTRLDMGASRGRRARPRRRRLRPATVPHPGVPGNRFRCWRTPGPIGCPRRAPTAEDRGAAMAVRLGHNQYGKAETRLVRVTRDGGRHQLEDLNVSVTLSGDLDATHLTGDNANVVPTDTQKNTVYAFAKQAPVGEVEEFGLRLARHFVDDFAPITRARVQLEEYPWARIEVDGAPHPHAFVRAGGGRRTATVGAGAGRALG